MIITLGSTVKDDKNDLYVLDKVLGSGGFGDVYKAHAESGGKNVAIKFLQQSFNSNDAYLSFQKETNLSKLIESDNVIKYLFIHDGKQFPEYPPYIIMEYTDGGTLRDLIDSRQGKQFDIETLKSILIQLAKGMKCVSEHLVHRDIKPENILNFNGILKISDFGLSKISGESTKTMSFKNGGTPLYIAPEAWNNNKNTIQMDIYSMGIVFYELATLSYPYSVPADRSISNIMNMHLYKPVINPSSVNKELPPNITSMLIKMLEKPTQARFDNWDDIISALEIEELPDDKISDFVTKALSSRNEKDIQKQKQQAEKDKAISEKVDYIKFLYSQFQNTVLMPLKSFADRFNSQYQQRNEITIKEREPHFLQPSFSTGIMLPSGNEITITGDILFKENFERTESNVFGEKYKVNYIPKCKGKDILLWCQINDRRNLGFNLLLLKNDDSLYGDWFVLENSSSGFSRTERPSPFGFSLSELPKEINLIDAMHIYNSKLIPFSQDYFLNYIIDKI